MKFTLVMPCANCPFSKNLPLSNKGWLGKERMQEIVNSVFVGYVFPCHKTLHLKDRIACAGARAFRQKCTNVLPKHKNDLYELAERLNLEGASTPVSDQCLDAVFDTVEAIVSYHTGD